MKKIWLIACKDFRSYFTSPIAYIVIAAFLAVMGYMFLPTLYHFEAMSAQYTQYTGRSVTLTDGVIRPVYGNMNVVLFILLPFITMRLFAEERKLHTLELLLTSPVTLWEIVLGKFFSSLFLVSVMLGITLIYPAILYITGSPDTGPILGAYLGIFLMSASYLAIGVLYSAVTENQIVAGALTFATILLCWIVNWTGQYVGPVWSDILDHLSLVNHYQNFSQGLFSTTDIIFFLSFIWFWLFLTHRALDSYRWR